MADYIDRGKIFPNRVLVFSTNNAGDVLMELVNHIANLPTADVAEVVRCKDCISWTRNGGRADSPNGDCFCHYKTTNAEDFCSYGERKEKLQ